MYKPIHIKDLSYIFSEKTCFEDFSVDIHMGDRIAIIGKNGCGKSSLLKMLQGILKPSFGSIEKQDALVSAYIPQVIESYDSLSGGERLNKALTMALSKRPDLLLLDEPTNHLDTKNRTSLMRLLRGFTGTLVIATHDIEILQTCVDTIWHIEEGTIHVFNGRYHDYRNELDTKRHTLEQKIKTLNHQKKETHQALMKEQHRASKSRKKGEKSIDQCKWPTVVSKAKAKRAAATHGRKKSQIREHREDVQQELQSLWSPEILTPKFHLKADSHTETTLVSVTAGGIYYKGQDKPVLQDIYFSLPAQARIAIKGNNASGKSTLIKAILQDPKIYTTGEWVLPKAQDIGYLDQHYRTLCDEDTVLDTIKYLMPNNNYREIRSHLNDFLFRKNEEVQKKVSQLSGGEKVRLCLAQIAVQSQKVLILDEITNNLDLETKEHIVQILKQFPGSLIVISHDQAFLEQIQISHTYETLDGTLHQSL